MEGKPETTTAESGGAGDSSAVPRHPPPAPPAPRKLRAETVAEDAELEALSSMLTTFKWSNDAVETCARAILDPTASAAVKQKGVLRLKQLLCTSREHVFRIAQDVIESGVLKALVNFIAEENYTVPMRLAAAFCLTNIAAGRDDQTAAVVNAGVISPCLELLRSDDEQLRRQAIFCLANIAGSTPEFRRALACHEEYFDLLVFAVTHGDAKMEELAGWNIRNMCVLGGPDYNQVRPGVDFFARQLIRNSPIPDEIGSMLTNGLASFLAVTQRAPPQCFARAGYAAVLRFACETFSWVSRGAEGRADIINSDLVLPLLFHSKFSPNSSVRSYASETLSNLAQFGGAQARRELESCGAVPALAELLADPVTYPPHQRVLAARCLFWIANWGPIGAADLMVEHSVVTREAALQTLQRRASRRRQRENNLDASSEGDDFDDWTGFDRSAFLLPGLDTETRAASTLEVAFAIFNQTERPEEYSLREKSGRLMVAILSRVSQPVMFEATSPETFRLLLDILDMAIEIDSQGCLAGEPTTVPPGASAIDALKVGEPDLPPGAFVTSVLQLLERFFDWGNHLRQREHLLENPVAALLRQCDGFQRLQAVTATALPFEVIQQAVHMIQMYCHP
eukprot:Protomagalhaensia_sp_Gyna_25__5453@NODE_716_length_2786_cov_26_555879_g558_i0_p1_GENE_NODE_716_length_2786_cov_26_555879_g558_i0NODE_716_length_2786_cov_26_555879_g558_i0_p1_ORF_typecomplete_len677_score132_44Arm/PF00514_23/0_001Arm/PF00514_23/3_3e09Arm/PF00514_23/0_27Arm/PF00514_23/2_1HEAT_2/PF13646_6/64HEAT_2/PF13646_6/0_00081HEAT_2/PF13646_6/0_004Arm_2/PF04826_13/0_00037Arm_2/PF04826_13/32KAP/PF05804_12/0_0042KAP/PF05804_12/1_6Proteasom_PSMB/PF10508_9/0_063Proteasom_PSMB/PF10508_9/0_61Vac14_F